MHEAISGAAERLLPLVHDELRKLVGLTLEEIAELFGVSPRTVNRDHAFAKAWLGSEIKRLRR